MTTAFSFGGSAAAPPEDEPLLLVEPPEDDDEPPLDVELPVLSEPHASNPADTANTTPMTSRFMIMS